MSINTTPANFKITYFTLWAYYNLFINALIFYIGICLFFLVTTLDTSVYTLED